ncbi:DUF308 domain-containing protein [Hyphomicrobium sp.]|jgi:uncharacterized membrane protein HdeD (DUF308 family)|uniref:DUF308 domain-containing protein n=1 Tax=Hyphomicrobium sp. TaxID=82 RepID=UPI003562BF97
MTTHYQDIEPSTEERWLTQYYFFRAAFSVLWVTLALSIGRHDATVAAVLLTVYPAWDAVANYIDAARSGGLAQNRTQSVNVVVSLATTIAVVVALQTGMNQVLGVFGAWAILAGLLQLATAIRRWKSYGAQWAMVLSGAQSALAGGFFIAQANMPEAPSIGNIAGYAGVGALYFLISAVWLITRDWRRKSA